MTSIWSITEPGGHDDVISQEEAGGD